MNTCANFIRHMRFALGASCIGFFGLAQPSFAETVKRTLIPVSAEINKTARTLPVEQRDPFYAGMLNLIFTLQPAHGENTFGIITRTYSTAQIVEIGRGVQSGPDR